MRHLKDICSAQSSNIALKDLVYDSGPYPIFGAGGLITHVDFCRITQPYVGIVKDGAGVGRVMLLPANSSVIGTMQSIIPAIGTNVKYLSYLLDALKLGRFCTGATIPHIYFKNYGNEPIPTHTIEQQDQISAVLDKITDLVAFRQQQLDKLDLLAKSRFIEMFGDPVENPKRWPQEELNQHVDVLTGYPFDSSKYVDDGIKICGGLIILPGEVMWTECKHWPSITGFEDYLLQAKDIVLALDRPWISDGFKIAQIHGTDLPCLLIQRTARIRGKDFNQSFLYALLNSDAFQKHCTITGSLVPHISHKDIKSFRTIVPPLPLQNEFAAFIEQLDKSKVTIQKSLDRLNVLYKALLQEYFG